VTSGCHNRNGGNECRFYHLFSLVIDVQVLRNSWGEFGTNLVSKGSVSIINIETIPM